MNQIPFDTLAVYVGLAAWILIAAFDYRKKSFAATIVVGIVLTIILNLRYLIDGAADGIAFFVGLYDLFDNIGLGAGETASALATCPANECSTSGFTQHQSWGVAFYERFANGPDLRSNLLYAHLTFNTIVFVLMHYQLLKPGTGANQAMHRMLGRISFACLTLGTICAIWLASEHGPVGAYGGDLSTYGFYFMSFCVYGCAVMGVVKVRGGDMATHRIWMIRFAGAMYGAYWLFRIMLIVTGPLFREYESVSLLLSIWLSAPLGIVAAELLRKHLERVSRERRSDQIGSALGASPG